MQHVQLTDNIFHMRKGLCIVKHFSGFVRLWKKGKIFAQITSQFQVNIVTQELTYPYKIILGPFMLPLVYNLLGVWRYWGFVYLFWVLYFFSCTALMLILGIGRCLLCNGFSNSQKFD